jgi:comEA protein
MRGIFTREERAVVLFLALSLLAGSAVLQARRVFPEHIPDFSGEVGAGESDAGLEAPAGPVDINAATAEELIGLPGIGPVRAAAIVELRAARGSFASLDELLDVRGIGPVTLERIRGRATVGNTAGSVADSCAAAREPG